jgi:pimeloyl-ACP methyl ester carboxylesterase
MSAKNLIYNGYSIEYYQYGDGPEWLFCLHGLGENGADFAIFEQYLGKKYSIIAFNLPLHGNTTWHDNLIFAPNELLDFIDFFVKNKQQKFSLIGYSMGGRLCLHLLQLMPERIEKVLLIAPDGLQMNFWYWLATQTKYGNRLFKYTMKDPTWFLNLVKVGHRWGLLNKSIVKYVQYYIGDTVIRSALYKRWTTMRKFKPNLKKLRFIIAVKKIPVTIFFGKYDRIILAKRGLKFQEGNENIIRIKELDTGHQLLKTIYAAEIAAVLTD